MLPIAPMSMPDLIPQLRNVIHETALPFLNSVQSDLDSAAMARDYRRAPHTPKRIGFVLARAGHTALALSVIDEAVALRNTLSMKPE